MSRNYVTKRQSLKLLGELLLNRSNFAVMIKYINSADNLKIMMNLLRGTTKAIQFEAFHGKKKSNEGTKVYALCVLLVAHHYQSCFSALNASCLTNLLFFTYMFLCLFFPLF